MKLIKQKRQRDKADKAKLKGVKAQLSDQNLDELTREFSELEFKTTAHCIIHDKQCCLTPRANSEFDGWRWIFAAGTVCCPFSNMSKYPS
eukprot:224186-Pyramimonas_sp.AAC.1